MMFHIKKGMAVKWAFVGLLLFLVFAAVEPVVHADQQYAQVPLKPSYMEKLSAGVPVRLSLPLGSYSFGRIKSVMITFNVNVNSQAGVQTNFVLDVDGQACGKFYLDGTAVAVIRFDCSVLISDANDHELLLWFDNNISSLSGGADIIYDAIPAAVTVNSTQLNQSLMDTLKTFYGSRKGSMEVGGTDYWQGETAIVFLQLQDASGYAVNNASCRFDMYNATNPLLSPVYSRQPMVFRGSDGLYYYQFSTIGLPAGVYPLDAECSYVYDNFYYYPAGSAKKINVTINSGTLAGGDAFALNDYADSLYMTFTGMGNITFRWDNLTNSTSTTALELLFLGEMSGIRTLNFYALNHTSGGYVLLGTLRTLGTESVSSPTGLDLLFTANLYTKDFINSTGSVSVQIFNTGGGIGFVVNWLALKAYSNATYVSEVKGSSEVHIYPLNISDLPLLVWGHVNRTLTDYNLTELYGLVWNISMTSSQLLAYSGDINLTVTDILQIAKDINLTASQTLSLLQSMNVTVSDILDVVQGLNVSINMTLSGNITLNTSLTPATVSDISEKVWLQFLTLGTPPLMKSTEYSCIDNTTLQKDNTFDVYGPGGVKTYTKSEQEYCQFGCDFNTNQCVPPPINRAGMIAVLVVVVLAMIILVRRYA